MDEVGECSEAVAGWVGKNKMCEEGRFGKPRVGKGKRQRIRGTVVVANKAIVFKISHFSVSSGKGGGGRFP
jgi:hypothetical protein